MPTRLHSQRAQPLWPLHHWSSSRVTQQHNQIRFLVYTPFLVLDCPFLVLDCPCATSPQQWAPVPFSSAQHPPPSSSPAQQRSPAELPSADESQEFQEVALENTLRSLELSGGKNRARVGKGGWEGPADQPEHVAEHCHAMPPFRHLMTPPLLSRAQFFKNSVLNVSKSELCMRTFSVRVELPA